MLISEIEKHVMEKPVVKFLILSISIITTHAFTSFEHNPKNPTELDFYTPQTTSNITHYSDKHYPEPLANDPRLVRNPSSPKWLSAIGRSVSHTSAVDKEQCTMFIIANTPGKNGIIALTAGHCVDHWAQADGSFDVGNNKTTFTTNSGSKIERSIVAVLKAEVHQGDYAIVKLNAPIKNANIKPLLSAPYDFADLLDDESFHKPYATMAGYSADKGQGQKGKVLTYHERCRLNGGARGMKKGYCHSYQGASGGPVVVTVALGEFADEPWQEISQSYFVGSIVGSHSGDDNSKTLFTETTYYARTLDKILANH